MEYWVIMIGFNRLNVSENKSYVCKKGKKHTKYKNVRDSEFFCNNEKTLKKILEFKQGIIYVKYHSQLVTGILFVSSLLNFLYFPYIFISLC